MPRGMSRFWASASPSRRPIGPVAHCAVCREAGQRGRRGCARRPPAGPWHRVGPERAGEARWPPRARMRMAAARIAAMPISPGPVVCALCKGKNCPCISPPPISGMPTPCGAAGTAHAPRARRGSAADWSSVRAFAARSSGRFAISGSRSSTGAFSTHRLARSRIMATNRSSAAASTIHCGTTMRRALKGSRVWRVWRVFRRGGSWGTWREHG